MDFLSDKPASFKGTEAVSKNIFDIGVLEVRFFDEKRTIRRSINLTGKVVALEAD
jgi:hypothetical protein